MQITEAFYHISIAKHAYRYWHLVGEHSYVKAKDNVLLLLIRNLQKYWKQSMTLNRRTRDFSWSGWINILWTQSQVSASSWSHDAPLFLFFKIVPNLTTFTSSITIFPWTSMSLSVLLCERYSSLSVSTELGWEIVGMERTCLLRSRHVLWQVFKKL